MFQWCPSINSRGWIYSTGKNGIVRFHFIAFFSFAMSDILYFPHISTRGNRCLCEIHPREWVPPSTLLSSLPALILPSPCLIRHALILLANFHERWYWWWCCVRPRGLRSSWQCIAWWGGRVHCSSTLGLASPKHDSFHEDTMWWRWAPMMRCTGSSKHH